MSHPHRRGFTLVELLVVITIITILASIAVPAVLYAIENARQVQCQNNLREIAKGLVGFEARKGYFPGYSNMVGVNRVGWYVEVLPNLDRQDIYDQYLNGPVTGTPPFVDMLTCPTNAPPDRTSPYTAYVGNGGYYKHTSQMSSPTDPERESINYGIMHDYCPMPAIPKSPVRGPKSTATINDGTGSTLLVSENMALNNQNFLRWDVVSQTPSPADKWATTFVWHPQENPVRLINGAKNDFNLNDVAVTPSDASRPSAGHSSGAMAAFAGTNVQFLRQDIDYKVYTQLMTPNHSKIQIPNAAGVGAGSYVLSGGDY